MSHDRKPEVLPCDCSWGEGEGEGEDEREGEGEGEGQGEGEGEGEGAPPVTCFGGVVTPRSSSSLPGRNALILGTLALSLFVITKRSPQRVTSS